jgi:hypothetical protein
MKKEQKEADRKIRILEAAIERLEGSVFAADDRLRLLAMNAYLDNLYRDYIAKYES